MIEPRPQRGIRHGRANDEECLVSHLLLQCARTLHHPRKRMIQ
jgi:hypothetical protein